MSNITLGSLFDGSGGFPLGGLLSGITPLWASEIEPFPIRVTTKRLPFMKHYGDISAMDGSKIEPVDIICFGSPCTDMSIAGRRAGLEGKQSVLFYEAIRIIKEMRCATNGKYPRWICWENVPGAFSSNAGHDFQAVLEAIISIAEPDAQVPMPEKGRWPYADCYMGSGWSVAYRTLDCQYWGLPQRRKRIFLIGDFAGECAGKVLFESEGLSGYSAESFRTWQRAAGSLTDCVGATGFDGYNGDLTGEISSTLGANCGMSTGRNGIVLNDQGGNRMDVTDEVCATLRAEAHHPPCVLESAGFCTEHSANSRSIGYEDERSPTLRAGVVPAVFENHSQDTRFIGPVETAPTIAAKYGTGGNNQPFVVSNPTPKTLKVRSGCDGGGKGALVQDNKSATLSCNNDQTLFEPCNWDGQKTSPTLTAHNAAGNQRMPDKNHFNCVLQAFGISSKDSNAMKSSNPHAGIYKAETSRTLDGNGGNPSCNQGGIAIVSYGIDRAAYNQGENAQFDFTVEKEVEPTLVAKGPGAVAAPILSASKASFFTQTEENIANTLVATDYKDPPLINRPSEYTVRRLTPTECARLQGFPDWWCSNLGTDNPSDKDLRYWYDVFETHRKITSLSTKPKSLSQIVKWLKNPHSDSAEYKMWGNGVALPCVYFVLSGIVYCTQEIS